MMGKSWRGLPSVPRSADRLRARYFACEACATGAKRSCQFSDEVLNEWLILKMQLDRSRSMTTAPGEEEAFASVRALADGVRCGASSATAFAIGAISRIEALDRRLNAFLTVADAGRLPRETVSHGPLAGVPVAIKDLTDTAGLRTTYGSVLYADNIPANDDLVVARLRRAGAIVVGKTMTPEFGFGAICTNALGGPTRNPWDLNLTSGGSSGGSAVAVASGMVPIAHGTDFGGSVRTPASFCGVLALRPTPGAIPSPSRGLAYDMLATHGFLARSVDDLEVAFQAVAGGDLRDPTSLPLSSVASAAPPRSLRIAATEDFGVAPISRDVRAAMHQAIQRVERVLGPVAWEHPDCAGAVAAFHVLRSAGISHTYGPLLAKHGEALSPTVRWAIGRGAGISAADYLAAEAVHSALYRRFVASFERCDVLLAPAASVLPWPNTVPDVTEIDGRELATIIDYLAVTFLVSMAGCPVVTLPAWTAGNLPFGIQLIGPPGSDHMVLAIARRFERELGFAYRRPPRLDPA
jgi:amidase